MSKEIGFGVTLTGSTTGAIGQIISIGVDGQTCQYIDVTNAESAGGFEEFLPTLLSAGRITVLLIYDSKYGGAGNGEAELLDTAFKAKRVETWTIRTVSGSTWASSGFIVNLGLAIEAKGGIVQPVTIKCTGASTYTKATS
jgi:hypothetical protein